MTRLTKTTSIMEFVKESLLEFTENLDNGFELEDHLVQYDYVDTLRFLVVRHTEEFAKTGNFYHYKQSNMFRNQINNIINGR